MNRKQTKTVLGFHSHRTRRRKNAALLLAASCFVTAGNASAFRIAGAAIPLETVSSQDAADNSSNAAYQLPGIRAPESAATDRTDQEWIAALPDGTGLTLREKLARTAESQLGYQEHERSPEQAAEHKHGHTLYGEWYGDPCGDWNPMFVYYCLDHAGVPPERLLIGGSSRAWAARLEDAGLIRNAGNGTPVRGDILLLDTDSDGKADRTGIVTMLQNDGSRLVVAAAEGDCDGTTAEQCYFSDAREILGFVSPEDPETCPALEYCSVSESGIIVYASADQDTFPAGTVMSVSDIAQEDALQIASVSAEEHQIILSAVAVDITFRDENGQELEPANGQKVSIRLTLPESGQLRGDSFSLLHQTDDGSVENIPDAEITSDAVAFEADSFSIYIVSGGSEHLAVDDLHTVGEGSNSADNPYIMRVGDRIQLAGYSNVQPTPENDYNGDRYLYPNNPDIVSKDGDPDQWITNRRLDDGTFKSEAIFIANSVGNTSVSLEQIGPNGEVRYERFFIKVVYQDSILVKTHFEPDGKGYHHIKESLSFDGFAHGNYFWIYTANQDGYIPNGPEANNTINEPYMMLVGQEVTLFPLILSENNGSPPELQDWDNFNWAQGQNILTDLNQPDPEHPNSRTFRATAPGDVRIYNPQTHDIMYIRVHNPDKLLNHSDMEIADGGRYTISKTIQNGDEKITEVTVYNAYISYVNWSKVYDANDQLLKQFSSDNGEYMQIGVPGKGQYEYTSAFYGFLHGSEDEKGWKGYLTDHVVFNVKLSLVPNYKYTINGDVISDPDYSVAPSDPDDHSGWIDINEAIFNLGKQDIIDAMNKCPFTNGLDFTVIAKAAMLQINASKHVTGVPLNANDYCFDVTDTATGMKVATAYNDEDGNIRFDNLRFEKEGTYIYELSEKIPGPDDRTEHMLYDQTKYRLTIKVSEYYDAGGNPITLAEVTQIERKAPDSEEYEEYEEQLEFSNNIYYELPATGGTGILPYLIVGTGFIALSFILLLSRRRKEVSDRP